ncbi:MAG: caspase family protein, partial [Thermoguttaceae bacterium]|nr:caspase family protein [Thermoguttaceae bacterium]
MKKILFFLLSLAIPALLLAVEPVREWKSQSGETLVKGFLDSPRESDDPEMVYLFKRVKVPFNKLSKEDQDYVLKARAGARGVDDKGKQTEDAPRGMQIVSSNNRYALLIGVNEYAAPIKSLNYCVQDMTYLAECFKKLGFQDSNIFLVTDDSPAARRPTGANIRNQIETITNMMRPGDQLIVAFSGHGVMVDGKNYLCPSDTNLEDKNSIVSREWVFDQLEKSKARQKIFFVDACRNEISFSGGKALGQAKTVEDPIGADTHGFILIASCDKQQQSWEHPDIKHGVFTYFLGKGIAGEAADKDGYVNIMGLFNYASSNTKSYVFRNFNKLQVPTFGLRDAEGTDFCIGKLPTPTSVVDNKAGEGKPPVVPPAGNTVGSVTPPVELSSGQFAAGERKTYTIK